MVSSPATVQQGAVPCYRNVASGHGRVGRSRFSATYARNGCSGHPRTAKVRRNARGVCVARYYDPSTGEFLSLDPAVAHTEAPFNYAIDDPVNVADPSGEGVECFVTLGFFGCPSKQVQQANILIKALRQLESTLCMEAGNDESYANSTVAQAAQSTLSYVSDFLLCAGDEFAGGDIVDILSGCLKGQVAGELIDQLNQDSGLSQLAVNFLLDPVGTLLNELSSVFTLAAQVFVKVGLALQYNPATDYELNYVQNGVPYFIIIPKNLLAIG